MLTFLLTLAIFGGILYLLNLIPAPQPVHAAINVVATILIVVWAMRTLLALAPAGLR